VENVGELGRGKGNRREKVGIVWKGREGEVKGGRRWRGRGRRKEHPPAKVRPCHHVVTKIAKGMRMAFQCAAYSPGNRR